MAKTMAGQSPSIRTKLETIFHLKSFLLTTAVLLLALAGGATYIITTHHDDGSHAPTGKVMATLAIAEKTPEPEPLPVPQPEPEPEPDKQPEQTPEPTPEPHVETEAPPAAPLDIEDSIAGLSEETSRGSLPIIRTSDNMTVFDAYKAPFTLGKDTKAVIILVMTDYGLSDTVSRIALEKLPAGMTFVTSPYSTNLQAKITAARTRGQEVWMDVPVQGKNFLENDTGPTSILSGLNAKQNLFRMETNLGRGTGYAGVVFAHTTDFPADSPDFQSLIDSLGKRGLGIAQLDPSDTLTGLAASQAKAPYIQNALWLDTTATKDALQSTLATLETTAMDKGYVVASFHQSALAADVIATWQKTLAGKHIQLAPLTYAIHQSALIQKK